VRIGQKLTVVNARNKSLVGKTGTVIDETKNTITIEHQHWTYTIIKDQLLEEHYG
jgi:RNase P/RNase MRP subunit p29